MTRNTKNKFPWYKFTMWLREGFLAAYMLNIFMISASSKNIQDKMMSDLEKDELDLLNKLAKTTSNKQTQDIVKMAKKGIRDRTEIKEEHLQQLWVALMEYNKSSKHFKAAKASLVEAFNQSSCDTESLVSDIMDVVWRTLGPATSPTKEMLEARRS
jgi:hypothetical protein